MIVDWFTGYSAMLPNSLVNDRLVTAVQNRLFGYPSGFASGPRTIFAALALLGPRASPSEALKMHSLQLRLICWGLPCRSTLVA